MQTMESYAHRLVDGIGYLTHSEVDLIKELARQLPAHATCCNIGIGAATSIIALLEERPELTVYSVDISSENGMSQLNETGYIRNVIKIIGDSKKVEWFYNPIDWLFIDGGHLRDEIEGDIHSWLPRMAENGLVLFDDYGDDKWPSVKDVVDFYARVWGWEQIGLVDNLIAFRVKRGAQ